MVALVRAVEFFFLQDLVWAVYEMVSSPLGCLPDLSVTYSFLVSLLVLFQSVGVSAHTGAGVPEFFEAVDAAVEEYER